MKIAYRIAVIAAVIVLCALAVLLIASVGHQPG